MTYTESDPLLVGSRDSVRAKVRIIAFNTGYADGGLRVGDEVWVYGAGVSGQVGGGYFSYLIGPEFFTPPPEPDPWEGIPDNVVTAVQAEFDALIDAAPIDLDTLRELADALGDDPQFATTVMASLNAKIDKASLDANTVLYATTDDTPAALAVPASTFVGRKASGNVSAMTAAEATAVLNAVLSATYVDLSTGQTIGGLKDFTTAPTVNGTPISGTVTDATTLVKGKVQLAGDLGGTASLPTVPALAAKAPIASPTFTGTVTLPSNAAAALAAVPKQQMDAADALKPTSSHAGWFLVEAYAGATADIKFAAALAAWAASGSGGTIFLGDGPYTMANAWQPLAASMGAGFYNQNFLRITGTGGGHNGRWGDPTGGTVVDMTYNGVAPAKIDTRGLGTIEIDHINFKDTSGSVKPFFQTTNTTPKIHDCSFQGSKTSAWDQDCIVLGGSTTNVDGSSTAAFQGYGGFVRDNYFDKIRRGVYMRTYCNGFPVYNNTFSTRCGADAGAAAIEVAGGPSVCTGNHIYDNVIEMIGYVYGVLATNAPVNVFGPNGFYDNGEGVLAYYRLATGSEYCTVIDGFSAVTQPLVSEAGTSVGNTTQFTGQQSMTTVFAQIVRFTHASGTTFVTPLRVTGGTGAFVIQPAAAQSEFSVLARMLRSAAEGTNPGTKVWEVLQNGTITVGGTNAGNVSILNDAGTALVNWTNNGMSWSAAGSGNILRINSGSGAQAVDITSYLTRLYTRAGVLLVTVGEPGIGLFGKTNTAQPARAGQLTDSSGGASGGSTIAAVTDIATAANAIATIAARYNLLEGKLSAAGTGIGVTA